MEGGQQPRNFALPRSALFDSVNPRLSAKYAARKRSFDRSGIVCSVAKFESVVSALVCASTSMPSLRSPSSVDDSLEDS